MDAELVYAILGSQVAVRAAQILGIGQDTFLPSQFGQAVVAAVRDVMLVVGTTDEEVALDAVTEFLALEKAAG